MLSVLESHKPSGQEVASEPKDRRRHARVQIEMPGRLFVPADARETPCKVVDISPSGAQLRIDAPLAAETSVVLYIDGLGRFEGDIAWHRDERCGIRFASGLLKQERTAEMLSRVGNAPPRSALAPRESRVPANTASQFVRVDGALAACAILNLSTGGALIKTDVRPAIGEYILIGRMAARVVRYHEEGIGIEFVR